MMEQEEGSLTAMVRSYFFVLPSLPSSSIDLTDGLPPDSDSRVTSTTPALFTYWYL